MRTLLPIAILMIALVSCSESDKNNLCENTCGAVEHPQHPIASQTVLQYAVVDGKARYWWDIDVTLACTMENVIIIAWVYIDPFQAQVPLDVTLITVINGEIETRDLPYLTDNPSEPLYHDNEVIDLNSIFSACFGGLKARVQIEFQTTGSRAFDDAYMDDVIRSNSELEVFYNEYTG